MLSGKSNAEGITLSNQIQISKQFSGNALDPDYKGQRTSQPSKNSNSFMHLSSKPKSERLDKLVKKNLRKKGKKEAEEMLKKFMEETTNKGN